MRSFLTAVLFVIATGIVAPVHAQSAFARVDMKEGAQPFVVYQFTLSGWQFFAFDAHNLPEWEVGRELKAVKVGEHTLSASGYVAYQSGAGTWFILPWAHARGPIKALKANYVFNLSTYVPLNGGPHRTFSDDSNVMWKVTDRLSLGVSGRFVRSEGVQNAGVGPKVSIQVTKRLKVHLRYLAMQNGPDVSRVHPVMSF